MAQELKTVIVIGGRVDNSFTQIGERLMTMASQLEQISRPVREYLTDSLKNYASYDDMMREAQAVGEFSAAEMKALDDLNRQVAKGSIYTREEAAKAEVFLGQLGLSTREITTLLPSVLRLSQAGNLDLADAVNYLYSSIMSLNLEMSDAGMLTDLLAKTAAIGATDVDTLGQSLTRIGSGLQLFKGGAPEVLTILSAISAFGEDMRGLTGGTQLRNFALSLVAPVGAGKQLQKSLEKFGLTRDELESYFDKEGIKLTSAAAAMEKLGLKVFDANGEMRGMLDIISDMRTALDKLDDERRAQFLREVFGKRGYVTAENILRVTDREYGEEMAQILDSEGFAQSMADTMQGGIGGAIRSLEASMDNLQLVVGEALAPMVQSVAEWLTEIVNSLSEMDGAQLRNLLDFAIALGGAGAALMGTGMALRLIGSLLSPAGMVAAGVVTLAALAMHMNRLAEEEFKGNFGALELDMAALEKYANSLSDALNAELEDINKYRAGLDAAVESYTAASTALSKDLVTKVLTGAELTEADHKKLQGLGDDMYNSLVEGIKNSYAESLNYIELLWGDESDPEKNKMYSGIIGAMELGYESLLKQAEKKSQDFRKALTSAFKDGTLTADERDKIMSIIAEYNTLLAQVEDRDRFIERETLLRKAQTVGWDSADEYAEQLTEQRDKNEAALAEKYERTRAAAKWDMLERIRRREINQATGGPYTQADLDAHLALMDRDQEEGLARAAAEYNNALIDMYDMLFRDSDFGDAWAFIKQLYKENWPDEVPPFDRSTLPDLTGLGLDKRISEDLAAQIKKLAGVDGDFGSDLGVINQLYEAVYDRLGEFEGTHEGARRLLDLLWLARLLPNAIAKKDRGYQGNIPPSPGELLGQEWELSPTWWVADWLQTVTDRWQKEGPSEPYKPPAPPPARKETYAPPYLPDEVTIDALADTGPAEEAIDALNGLNFEVQAVVNWQGGLEPRIPEPQEPVAVVLRAGQEPEILIDALADTGPAEEAIDALNGTEITVRGDINKAEMQSDLWGRLFSIRVKPQLYGGAIGGLLLSGYADGGRAAEPSIFGDAGPEWAIPEAHNTRTADLFNAARAASGFTWGELMERAGAFSGGASGAGGSVQIMYSPTIIANDADGVEEKLREDKRRFERWYEGYQRREALEAYA